MLYPSCGRREAMIFLQKLTDHLLNLSCGSWEAMIFLQNLSDRMLPFLWQAGSQNSFAKTGNSHATLPVVGGKPWYFCKTWQTARYTLPVAGGEPWHFFKNLTDRLLPSCGRRGAKAFFQKPDRPHASFLWQAGSHDIFAKTDRLHAILPVAGGKPQYFCKNLTVRMLPFLWQAGSHDILAKTGSSHATHDVAGGKPRYFFLLQM